ncbi:hypothetical protein VNO80_19022 [Phaseolus coccineus]|uniref:Uncharacterized protein n=1 Tax=Phaseolus coccineus TaxID=3886 RepID=A0AAN9MKD9_PHACN
MKCLLSWSEKEFNTGHNLLSVPRRGSVSEPSHNHCIPPALPCSFSVFSSDQALYHLLTTLFFICSLSSDQAAGSFVG